MTSTFLRFAALLTLVAGLTGCGTQAPILSSSATSGSPVTLNVKGFLHGGQQPVSGAGIQLYATSGVNGGASTPLLTKIVNSASDGSFSITGSYTCPSAGYVYLAATGGNPGLSSSNASLALMTALGPCSALSASTFIQVNELTTVAAVAALTPYMTAVNAIGSPDAVGLGNAFTLASELVNPVTGISPGTGVPAGATVPTALINTLGDIVSSCVNSTGGVAADTSMCGQLFALTTIGSQAPPTNTVSALLNLAYSPASSTTALFNLLPASPPFQSVLSAAPASWAVQFNWPSSPAALQILPSSLSFPVTAVGTTSAAQTVTLQNSSSSTPISISSISVAGFNASDFTATNNCPAALALNNACTVQVTASPAASGARFADLIIQSSSLLSPQYVPMSVANPLPAIGTIYPSSLTAGSTSPTTILVIGSNLLPSSFAQVGGYNRPTTYISPTELTFQLLASDQSLPGKLSVTVVNPVAGGGTSASATLTLTAPTPTPVIAQTIPTQLTTSTSATSISVIGSNLTSNCVIQWNGTALTTVQNYSSYYGYYLTGTVPASLISATGTATITVYNSASTPTTSNAVTVSIVNPPAPTLTSLSPASVPMNTGTTLTIYGTNFSSGSTATFNGANLPVTYISSSQLTATISASSVPAPGNYPLTVTTPAPGGGTTAPVYLNAYIGIVNNSMVYNPVTGLFYVSVPGSAGVPYGNSIVSVDPATGALGAPIFVGSEPNKLAISSDGTILWVGLDGGSAVRQVNLATNTPGLQFSLGGNGGVYDNPATALALAALPGSPNSVVLSTNLGLGIYDSGVLRGTLLTSSTPYALLVDGTKSEIYAAGSNYVTYNYTSSGMTLKASSTTNLSYASYSTDEIQTAGGTIYTDYGQAEDKESGALLGTFYSSGTTVATGSTAVDSAQGRIFILDSTTSTGTQIQVFNTSNFNPVSTSVIPATIPGSSTNSGARLTRWGTNGIAFRGANGVVSLRSNLVKDLSSVSADLSVTLQTSGSSVTGSSTTYTATVTNNGQSASTNVVLSAFAPATGVVQSITPSAGTCSTANGNVCDLGGLGVGTSATVAIVVQQYTAGAATTTVQVSGSETDPVPANNQASASVTITGSSYALTPVIGSIKPSTVLAGSSATVITVTGTGFTSGSSVMLSGSALSTQFTSSSTLTAIVPATQLATLGWAPITVSTPAPGGGTSNAVPFSVYSVLTAGLNRMLYDPYSRNIMASVGSGASQLTGNSIVAINPAAASFGVPVPIGSQPTNLSLTSDGQILYTILSGSQSVARFNMLTQAADFTVAINPANAAGGVALRGVAAQPGTENTVALDIAAFSGNAIYDFNPTTKTAAIRGQVSGPYSGSCIQFLDSADMFAFDTDTSGATLDHYTVTSAGFTYYNYQQYSESTLDRFGCFKISGGLLYANGGGIANPATVPAAQVAILPGTLTGGTFSTTQALAPDASLQRAFYPASSTTSSSPTDSVIAYNLNTFLPSNTIPLNMTTTEGTSSYTQVDMVRWGQDGIAVLTSGGHVYLLRGAAVVPEELTQNSAAVLTSSSSTSIAHASGNTLLTFTGSNFLPGVGIFWNGSYRTTTIVDASHVTAAIPASDLATAGTATVTAVNAGAAASGSLTITIN